MAVEQLRAPIADEAPGPEDIVYWPETDLLWSVSEHPGRRWVFAMNRSRLLRTTSKRT